MAPAPDTARPAERAAALRVAFAAAPAAERDARAANALRLLDAGELPAEGLFVLREGGHVTAALLCVPFAGASAMLWPPASLDDARRAEREDALLDRAVAWLRGRGAKVIQSLLAPAEVPRGSSLLRHGFRHVTRLWQLGRPPEVSPDLGRLTFQPFLETDRDLFLTTLAQTYDGTLDCPELNGVRTVEEVVAGYRAQPTCRPDRWSLARHGGRPVGVLLLGEIPETAAGDLLYMGLVPAARRQGFGRELVRRALRVAADAGNPRLTVAVDARNAPAWAVYRAAGFEPEESREVFLHF